MLSPVGSAAPTASGPISIEPASGPRPEDRVTVWVKTVYGASGMASYWGGQLLKVLSASIFVAAMGMSPAGIGWVFLIFRLWDAMLDPLTGWLSDNTRSRWGRRRPFILVGGICMGLIFPLFWQGRAEWSESWKFGWLIGSGLLFYAAFAVWVMPYSSLLPEMTPDTDERTSISAYVSFFGKIAAISGTWVWSITQLPVFNDPTTGKPDVLHGMRVVGLVLSVLMILLSILPAFVIKERNQAIIARQPKTPFWPALTQTFANQPFRILAIFSLIFGFGINLVQGQIFYLRTYYALGGDTVLSAKLSGIEGTISMALGIISIPFFQWLCRKIGKKETLIVSTVMILVTTWLSWLTYTPRHPWLSMTTGSLLSPGYTGMWLVIPSMIADVIDFEELRHGDRREGGFTAVFNWLGKASISLAYALAGMIVVWCGFVIAKKSDQTPAAFLNMRLCFSLLPTVFLAPALFLIARYPLSHLRMSEIRRDLEARRGTMVVATDLSAG